MNFEEYLGKNIKIICTDGQIIQGPCCGYELAINDDELEENEIDIKKYSHIVCVKQSEIKTIETID